MTKTLQSGLEVDENQHDNLIDWCIKNTEKFIIWCHDNGKITPLLDSFTSEQYQSLFKFAGI